MSVDKSEARVRRMFGEIAGRYDLLNHLLSLNVDRYWRWRTVPRGARRGRGADPGSVHRHGRPGAGLLSGVAAEAPVIGGRFLPRDAGPGRPEAAAGRHQRPSWRSSRPMPSGCRFPTITFRSSRVAFGLRNVTDTDRGLAEMARVCRPGGQVAVLEFSMPRWQPFRGRLRLVLPPRAAADRPVAGPQSAQAYDTCRRAWASFPQGEALAERMRGGRLERRALSAADPGHRHVVRGDEAE